MCGTLADRISLELDWVPPAIANSIPFLLLEWVMSFSRQQQEPVAVTDVLHVRQPATFAVSALPVRQVDLVLLDEFPVDGRGIFALRNAARDIPPVAVPQIADGDLLNESFRG